MALYDVYAVSLYALYTLYVLYALYGATGGAGQCDVDVLRNTLHFCCIILYNSLYWQKAVLACCECAEAGPERREGGGCVTGQWDWVLACGFKGLLSVFKGRYQGAVQPSITF